MTEQLVLDLFGKVEQEREHKSPLDLFLSWAHEMHGCGEKVDDIAKEVFDRMPNPFDRCKALVTVFRCGRDGSEAVPLLGLFDEDISYHTCWDRAWGYVHGVPIELIESIYRCDYRCGNDANVFYDAGGAVVWECEANQ